MDAQVCMMAKAKVLFVCLGNICRSPMAEGTFRHLVETRGAGDRFQIDSAGMGSWHVGEPPDARAQAAAHRRGIDISTQRARRVAGDDFEHFTAILAMDDGNRSELLRLAPRIHQAKVRLFLEFAPGADGLEVPDPYYGGPDGFERVLDLIEAASDGLYRALTDGG